MNANEPVAWGFKDFEGNINDCICPEEHDRAEGDYTIPLYRHPVKELTDDELFHVIRRIGYTSIDQTDEIVEAIRKASEK